MNKIAISLIVVFSVLLSGCGVKSEQKVMTNYLKDLGYEVLSYGGKQGDYEIDLNDEYQKSIWAVQYDDVNKYLGKKFEVHDFNIKNTDSINASLIVIEDKIIGGYQVSKEGYLYSLDGKLADVTGLYNN